MLKSSSSEEAVANTAGLNAQAAVNRQQNIDDVITIFPKLLTGVDVNIQFKNVDSFEYTQDQAVFDTFNVALFHGWLPDPQVGGRL